MASSPSGSKTMETTSKWSKHDNLTADTLSPYFGTDPERMEAYSRDVHIRIHEKKISSMRICCVARTAAKMASRC